MQLANPNFKPVVLSRRDTEKKAPHTIADDGRRQLSQPCQAQMVLDCSNLHCAE